MVAGAVAAGPLAVGAPVWADGVVAPHAASMIVVTSAIKAGLQFVAAATFAVSMHR
jgi:hypothetical protein